MRKAKNRVCEKWDPVELEAQWSGLARSMDPKYPNDPDTKLKSETFLEARTILLKLFKPFLKEWKSLVPIVSAVDLSSKEFNGTNEHKEVLRFQNLWQVEIFQKGNGEWDVRADS